MKSREWYYQIAVSERYQTYDPLYADEQKEMPMISPGLDSIDSVPIHLLVGKDDTHCSLAHAKRIQSEIGPAVRSLNAIAGFSHGTFGHATGQKYVDLVLSVLAADDAPLIDQFL